MEREQERMHPPSAGQQPLPPDYQAAYVTQLGMPTAIYVYDKGFYRAQRAGHFGLVAGCVITPAVLVLSLAVVFPPFPLNLILGNLGALIAGVVIYAAVIPDPKQVIRLFFCPGGLVLLRRKASPDVIRWEQITRIWRTVSGATEDHGPEIGSYKIETASGPAFSFAPPEFVKEGAQPGQFMKLGHLLEQQLVQRWLPPALTSYQVGSTLPFGPLSLNRAGVSNGAELLPWKQVSQIEVEETTITIKQAPANLPWLQIGADKVPNVDLFQGIIHVLQSGQQ